MPLGIADSGQPSSHQTERIRACRPTQRLAASRARQTDARVTLEHLPAICARRTAIVAATERLVISVAAVQAHALGPACRMRFKTALA